MGLDFIDGIRNQLGSMTVVERRRVIESLREVIYEDAYAQSQPDVSDEPACP